jgi:hypothetical protein
VKDLRSFPYGRFKNIMIGPRFPLHVLALALALHLAHSLDAHSGTGSIVARDTDEESYLKGKLSRLINLLSTMKDGDENDLLKMALNKLEATTTKPDISAEDMNHAQQKKEDQKPSKTPKIPQKYAGTKPNKSLVSSQDSSSIEILAKALSRLKDPKFGKEDSDGDYLGTDYNGSRLDDEKTRAMELLIKGALNRLSEDRTADRSDKSTGSDDSALLDVIQKPKAQALQLREQVIRAVESRLFQTVLLADRLGITVNDLTQDLDNKAASDEKLEEIESDLDALNSQK